LELLKLLLIAVLSGALLISSARGQEEPPVASFDVVETNRGAADDHARQPADVSDTAPQAATSGADTPVLSFNFRFAPWPDVLKLFAETAGLTLDLTDTPPGTFSYFDTGKYTSTQALDILNGYLLPRGYVLVRRDRFLVCVRADQPIPPNLVPKVSAEELSQRGQNELLTVVFPLERLDAEQTASEVQQLLGPQGKAVSLRAANSLVVTDIGSNLRLVDGLLKRSADGDVTAVPHAPGFLAHPLKHISATEAERIVRRLLGMPDTAGTGRTGSQSAAGRGTSVNGDVQLTADSRTNTLLVAAPPECLETIRQVLQATDVDVSVTADGSARSGRQHRVEVLPLGSAHVARIGRTLGALSPRIRVSTTGGVEGSTQAAPPAPGAPKGARQRSPSTSPPADANPRDASNGATGRE
jgi:hypothetical protein